MTEFEKVEIYTNFLKEFLIDANLNIASHLPSSYKANVYKLINGKIEIANVLEAIILNGFSCEYFIGFNKKQEHFIIIKLEHKYENEAHEIICASKSIKLNNDDKEKLKKTFFFLASKIIENNIAISPSTEVLQNTIIDKIGF